MASSSLEGAQEVVTRILKDFAQLLVLGTLSILCLAAVGYLARWLPTWVAFTCLGIMFLGIAITWVPRYPWRMGWALVLGVSCGIGGAFTASTERKVESAHEYGPVPLSTVIDNPDHEAFFLRDVRFGDVEFEYTRCGEEDCYDEVLLSIQAKASGSDVPIQHWILASQDAMFDDQFIFSRIALTYHAPDELETACVVSGKRCIGHDDAHFFEPILPPSRVKESSDGDDPLEVILILLGVFWVGPVVVGAGWAGWRHAHPST
jgi:hypothetical protein